MKTNEAIKTLKDHKICFEHDFGWNRSVLDALDIAIEALAADVVAHDCYDRLLAENDELRKERPARHGRWIEARGSWCTPGGDPVWECSECGKGMHVYGIEHGTYGSDVADGQWVACPNCGAKMGGDGDV